MSDQFENLVLNAACEKTPEFFCEYDPDGDCLEIVFVPDGHVAKRLDPSLTVYYSRDTGEMVGALLKGVRKLLAKAMEINPGLRHDLGGGESTKVEKVLTAGLWLYEDGKDDAVRVYKEMRDFAARRSLTADFELA